MKTLPVRVDNSLVEKKGGRETWACVDAQPSKTTQPPTVACKLEARLEYMHVAYMFFARFVQICMLSRGLSMKISVSELRKNFIKSALLVGYFLE